MMLGEYLHDIHFIFYIGGFKVGGYVTWYKTHTRLSHCFVVLLDEI